MTVPGNGLGSLLVVLALIVVLLVARVRAHYGLLAVLREVAPSVGGVVYQPLLFGLPDMTFSRQSYDWRVEYRSPGNGEPRATRLVISIERHALERLRVYPRGLSLLHRPLSPSFLGMKAIESGDADFDSKFVVNAEDRGLAQGFLSTEVKRTIAMLSDLDPVGDILIQILPPRLTIRKNAWLSTAGSITSFIEAAQLLVNGYESQP